MGIFKVYIKTLLFFFFGYFITCKPSPKKEKPKTFVAKVKTDSANVYPSYLSKNYVLGKFDYTKHPDFIVVPKELSSKKIYIRKDVFDMFHKMSTQAKKEGISLKIISGTRNFVHQKRIWDWKWTDKYKKHSPEKRALKILEYSSMPGTSRHHWGTDIDINNLNNSYFSKGKGKKEYDWLLKNASKFGFYQVYTSKENGRTGYNEEKWHWSFVPLSSIYLKYYNEHVTHKDIDGFQGAEFAPKIDMITNYVNGIEIKKKYNFNE